jgi:ABC-type glutathione transport system ATPase component
MIGSVPHIDVHGLTRRFGEFTAVDDVSFTVDRGRSLGIVGESGSGKTTVARMLVGLVAPTSGSIVVQGRDRSRPPRSSREWRERASELQIVFQSPFTSLDPRQSATSCIDEVLRLRRVPAADRAARVEALCSLVGLDARQRTARPARLSGGQRQRVAIARSLAASPGALILDEAVAALDVSIQAQVLNTIRDVQVATGLTMIFITHDLGVVRQMTDELIVMRAGVVVERGETSRVLDDAQHPYTRLLRASIPGPGWSPRRRPKDDV